MEKSVSSSARRRGRSSWGMRLGIREGGYRSEFFLNTNIEDRILKINIKKKAVKNDPVSISSGEGIWGHLLRLGG